MIYCSLADFIQLVTAKPKQAEESKAFISQLVISDDDDCVSGQKLRQWKVTKKIRTLPRSAGEEPAMKFSEYGPHFHPAYSKKVQIAQKFDKWCKTACS